MLIDHDFKLLYDPRFDGVENDDEAAAKLGLVNLHHTKWFLLFSGAAGEV